VGITQGRLGTILPLPLESDSYENTAFGKFLGVYDENYRRMSWAKEFFDTFEKFGEEDFLSNAMFDTVYYKETLRSLKSKQQGMKDRVLSIFNANNAESSLKNKVVNLIAMYSNMKQYNGLAPSSKLISSCINNEWHYYDFPWAIDYLGYVKKRDGSHRRMIAHYLGFKTIDSIVVSIGDISENNLKDAPDIIKNNFSWFLRTIEQAKNNENIIN